MPVVPTNASDDAAQSRFQTLLAQHRGIVLKVAFSYCRNDAARDDLAQDICTQLWRSFASYDESRTFSTWMYRVALNVAISQVRRANAGNVTTRDIDGDDVFEVAALTASEPDERIAAGGTACIKLCA